MNKKIKTYLLNHLGYSPSFNKFINFVGGEALYAEYRVYKEKKRLLAIAKKEFERGNQKGNLLDYKNALKKHWISYNEYADQYDFPHKTEKERDEFVTRLKMVHYYLRYVPWYTKSYFRNKHQFLILFHDYIHREWIYTPESSFEEFERMVTNYDCIVKPCDDMRGHGVFKLFRNADHKNDLKIYEKCVKDRMLVEQCIESCEELKAFHPQSLNTIRVMTISNREKAEVFGSFFRMGVGDSVVDNAHAGGIFAQINIQNGIIESDGINTNGERFSCHPDSKLKIKGFNIPHWDQICDTCCEAAKLTDNTITGWDVVVNSQGEIEFVEGNNGADFDVMQSPLQVGVKKRIFAKIKEYSGIELK